MVFKSFLSKWSIFFFCRSVATVMLRAHSGLPFRLVFSCVLNVVVDIGLWVYTLALFVLVSK